MPSITEVRQKYPQYQDLSDDDLAGALHKKFYSDMPEPEFRSKIGLPDAAAQPVGKGVALNATAGVNDAIYTTLGAPVDLARGAINLGIRGANAATGAEIPTIPSDSFGGSESISSGFGAIGVPEPKDIQPANTRERIARGIGEGIGYTIAPEAALAGLSKAGSLTPKVTGFLEKLVGPGNSVKETAANAVVGGASGLGSSAAMEVASDQMKPTAGIVGGMGGGFLGALAATAPSMARGVGRVASDFIAPMTAAGQERLAGQQLVDSATNLPQVKSTLEQMPDNLVPGSEPTTFQVTGDMGLGGLERTAQTRNPQQFMQRRADQNAARVDAMGTIQPTGAPERVSQAARQFMQSVEARAQAALDASTEAARRRAATVGRGLSPEASGDTMRASLEEARAAAKTAERQLWSAVDPDGTLALPASNVRQQALRTIEELPNSAKPPSGEEAAMYGVLQQYGDVVPFSEMTALQSRLKAELRAERLANGESPAYRRLSQLNSAVERDIESGITGKIDAEAQAVASGQMSFEDSVASKMQQQVDSWFNERQALAGNTGSGEGSIQVGRTGSSPMLGVRGATGQKGRGLGPAPSDTGLPEASLQPNFDADAAARLRAAKDATRTRVATFDNGTLGPIRKRPSTISPYNMGAATVPQKLFFPNAASADAITKYRAAVGDGPALSQIQNYAVDRLRKDAMRPDGTLDPAKVDSWRRSHADALRSFPQLDQNLNNAAAASRTMADVARQQRDTLDELQRTRIGAVMGVSDPADITKVIGGLFGRQDAVREISRLRQAIGSDPEALTGLRKAVSDHITSRFVGNTEAATSGQTLLKSDQFQTFVKQNRNALSAAGFTREEIGNMEAIAADLQRANRSLVAVKIPGQSNTAQDTLKVSRGDKATTVLGKILVATGAGAGSLGGGMLGAAAGALGAKAVAGMREAGIESVDDLVADALLNPKRAKYLLEKAQVRPDEGIMQFLGAMYRRSVIPTAAATDTDQ